jgi:hypothetical protein
LSIIKGELYLNPARQSWAGTTDEGPKAAMKIAPFNVNGVNGRLPVLLRWLDEYKPDVACVQELKRENAKNPEIS